MAVTICTDKIDAELLLAKFANGDPINETSLTNIQLWKSKVNEKQKCLTVETNRLKYHAFKNAPNSTQHNELCKQYAGILDKTTNKMHIVDCSFFTMKPDILDNIGKTVESKEKTIDEARAELTMAFGSMKRQRSLKLKQGFKVKPDEVKQTMHETVDSVSLRNEPDIGDKSLDSLLPARNVDAKLVSEVYNIDDVVSKQTLTFLEEEAKTLSNYTDETIADWETNKTYPTFVLNCLKKLPYDEGSRHQKCLLLAYYTCLCSLLYIKPNEVRRANPLPKEIPEQVRKKLKAQFFCEGTADEGKKILHCIMPDHLKDKVLLHLIILALIIDAFVTDVPTLISDFMITKTKLISVVRVTGARLYKSNVIGSNEIICLKLPLAKPITKIFVNRKHY